MDAEGTRWVSTTCSRGVPSGKGIDMPSASSLNKPILFLLRASLYVSFGFDVCRQTTPLVWQQLLASQAGELLLPGPLLAAVQTCCLGGRD